MDVEVETLIDELFTPASRENVAAGLRILRDEVKEIMTEVENIPDSNCSEAVQLFLKAWNLPRTERTRLIVYLVTGETILRRLEREETAKRHAQVAGNGS